MVTVKECILKNIKKPDKPFVRRIEIGYTGVDIQYGTEKQAQRFVSQHVAIVTAQDFRRYGDFRVVALEG